MGTIPWYRAAPVKRALSVQVAATLTVSMLAWSVSTGAAIGVLLGGAICIAATTYSAAKVFGAVLASPDAALAGLYRAEVGKLIIAGALLFVVLTCFEGVNFIALCVAFVLVQVSGSIAAAWAEVGPTSPERRI